MKKIISIILAFTFIFALSSCTNQSTSKSSVSRLEQNSVNLTKGPFAKENTEILNMTEKELKAIKGTSNPETTELVYKNYSYFIGSDGLVDVGYKTPIKYSVTDTLSESKLRKIALEITEQVLPESVRDKYDVMRGKIMENPDYYDYYSFVVSKKIGDYFSRDLLEIHLFLDGKLDFLSRIDIGKFDGIDKLDFDYDKALEACKKDAKKRFSADKIYLQDSCMLEKVDSFIYYAFRYSTDEKEETNNEYNYKICTVEEAKAYSAKS